MPGRDPVISDPERLAAVKRSGMLDTPPTAAFDRIAGRFVAVLERFHLRAGLAADLQDQLLERIAGARSRRRTVDEDRLIRQRGIDVGPGLGERWCAIVQCC